MRLFDHHAVRRKASASLLARSSLIGLLILCRAVNMHQAAQRPGREKETAPRPTKVIPAGNQAFVAGWRADGKTLALVNGQVVKLFDPENPDKATEIALPIGDQEMKLLSPDSTRVAIVPRFGDGIEIWDVDARRKVSGMDDAKDPIAFASEGTLLLALPTAVYDVETGRQVARAPLGEPAISTDGRLLAGWKSLPGGEKDLLVVDVQTGAVSGNLFHAPAIMQGGSGRLAFVDASRLTWWRTISSRMPLPNGSYTEQVGIEMVVWDATDGKLLASMQGAAPGLEELSGLTIAADGQALFAGNDQFLFRWNLKSGQMLSIVGPHRGQVDHLLLSRDGNSLYAISNWSNAGDLSAGAEVNVYAVEELVELERRPPKRQIAPKRQPKQPPADARNASTDEQRAAAWLRLARKHHDEGRDEQARKYAQKVIELLPDTPLAETAQEFIDELD